jgi:hypothetical protein
VGRWCHLPEMDVRPEITAICSKSRKPAVEEWFTGNFPSIKQVTVLEARMDANVEKHSPAYFLRRSAIFVLLMLVTGAVAWGLPAVSTVPSPPWFVGLLCGFWAVLGLHFAAMAVLPFSQDQMTLMAIFLLIAHNLIQEGIIQAKSGIHPLKATLFRIVAAIFTVIAVAPFFDITTTVMGATGPSLEIQMTLLEAIQEWALTTLNLMIKIFFIIMAILTLLEILKTFDLIHPMVRILNPVLRLMGLNQKVGFLWLTAVVFGVAYGGAVIVEEVKAGHLTKEELEELHLSIGINHALVEDPSLFLSLGLSPFWLWIPRLIVAILAERLLTLWRVLRRK